MTKPFIKYVGGKTALLPELLDFVPPAENYGTYYEPFVGGGALFWALRDHGHENIAMLSDINGALIDTYKAVRNGVEQLLNELEFLQAQYREQDSEDLYYRIRDAWNAGYHEPRFYLFLKSTGFNGLWRENKDGQYNVSWGKYKNPSIAKVATLHACKEALHAAFLYNDPWEKALETADIGDFVYVDPPYLGTFTAYSAGGFPEDDQESLLMRCRELDDHGAHVLYSNQDSPELDAMIAENWPDAQKHIVRAKRSINRDGDGRQPVNEVLLRSRHL